MVTKEDLQKYANKLMFKMNDEELETLEEEFKIILKQMEVIDTFECIDKVEPMRFPFVTGETRLREDVIKESLTVSEVLSNTPFQMQDQVKVPKVVK